MFTKKYLEANHHQNLFSNMEALTLFSRILTRINLTKNLKIPEHECFPDTYGQAVEVLFKLISLNKDSDPIVS